MTEDGTELRNVLQGNLAILPVPGFGPRNESMPAGFWISHPNITLINNAVAGSAFMGFWLAFTAVLPPLNTSPKNYF